jgi:hypothetical protein
VVVLVTRNEARVRLCSSLQSRPRLKLAQLLPGPMCSYLPRKKVGVVPNSNPIIIGCFQAIPNAFRDRLERPSEGAQAAAPHRYFNEITSLASSELPRYHKKF